MIYAMGDSHGHAVQIDRALRLIGADAGDGARVVFLGDYVDRGPDSAGVLQRLIDGQDAGRDWICLKGNHDRMFQRFLESGSVFDPMIRSGKAWTHESLGGLATLGSYMDLKAMDLTGLNDLDAMPEGAVTARLEVLWQAAREAVPKAHLAFLKSLPLWHREGDLIFVHAGIRPGVPMEAQIEDDLVWIREPFLSDPRDHGALVVHGHTIQERPVHCGNRVNLDGGAGAGRLLVPAVFEGGAVDILTERGRWPLRP